MPDVAAGVDELRNLGLSLHDSMLPRALALGVSQIEVTHDRLVFGLHGITFVLVHS